MNHPSFIEALVRDLSPVRPAITLLRVTLGWTILAWTFVLCLIVATGPMREGAIAAFLTSPRYALEFAFAVLGALTAIVAGLELGVPGQQNPVRLLALPGFFFLGWVGLVAYGLIDPAIETGMLGKRPFCNVQTVLFALLPLVIALFALRRRALFASGAAGILLGLGAAAIPAASMQIACLYDPSHALLHHLAPMTLVALMGSLAAHWTRRRI